MSDLSGAEGQETEHQFKAESLALVGLLDDRPKPILGLMLGILIKRNVLSEQLVRRVAVIFGIYLFMVVASCSVHCSSDFEL